MLIERISDVLGVQMKDSEGNTLMEFESSAFEAEYNATWYNPTLLLSDREKFNPDNIEKVIFNPPATIVMFKDGTKVVSKAHNEAFDKEKGLMACFMRIAFDTRADFNRILEMGIEQSNTLSPGDLTKKLAGLGKSAEELMGRSYKDGE